MDRMGRTVVEDVVDFSVFSMGKGVDEFSDLCIGEEGGRDVLDGSVDDLLGEVICAYVARDSDDVSSSGFDVVYDGV
jgi:hypothetical protein